MVERRRKEREKRRLDEEAAAAANAAMRALQPMSPTTELLNDVAPTTPATKKMGAPATSALSCR